MRFILTASPVGVRVNLSLVFRLCALAALLCLSVDATFSADDPTAGSARNRLEFLRSEIQRHDELYHRHAAPEITDGEYDELKRELHALEIANSDPAAVGDPTPTTSVTDDQAPGFSKNPHGEPMRSLAKAYSKSELRRFHERVAKELGQQIAYMVEPKFDGLAVSAIYERGLLARVLTRGNGLAGDDVTANSVKYARLPVSLDPISGQTFPERIELRGEVYMSLAEFDRLNLAREDDAQPGYASPRNLAVGTLRSHNDDAISSRRLEIVFYGIGSTEPESAVPSSQLELLKQLQRWGLPTIEIFREADSFETLWLAVEEMNSLRSQWPFPTDGIVVKVDSRDEQRALGFNEGGPAWAIAFKFTPERQTTRLVGITLQVGRTGLITPVAELEPVTLGGATIKRASLHNADEIARRDLRVGDHVVVERGGEIIPAIVGVDFARREAASTPYVFPDKCPACAQGLFRHGGQVAWRCTNYNCRAQIERRIRHFTSAACVGIRGLGEATIEKLVDSGKVRNVADLYALTSENLAEVIGIESANTLIGAIESSREAELWRVMYGLGIEGVGPKAARQLAKKFGSLNSLAQAPAHSIGEVGGISADVNDEIVRFFRRPETRQMLELWDNLGVTWPDTAR